MVLSALILPKVTNRLEDKPDEANSLLSPFSFLGINRIMNKQKMMLNETMPDEQQESAVKKVHNFTQFYYNFIELHAKTNNIDNYIFRGEGSSSYQLFPSALRESGIKKLKHLTARREEIYKHGSELEAVAIVNFYRTANRHGLYVPNLEEFADYNLSSFDLYKMLWKDDILQPKFYELYALAQHYGVPTRFLDWSFDIHVALWFAAYDNYTKNDKKSKHKGFAIWIMNYKETRKLQVKYPENSLGQRDKRRDRYLKFVVPPYANNHNLKAQKGILTYLPIQRFVEKPKDGEYYGDSLDKCILRTVEEHTQKQSYSDKTKLYLMKCIFPSEQAGEVLCFLKSHGYDLTTIYPGYGHITEALELEWKLDLLK